MRIPKFSVTAVSLAGIVLLIGGLGVAVLGAQQSHDTRSRAMFVPDDGGSTVYQQTQACTNVHGTCKSICSGSGEDPYMENCGANNGICCAPKIVASCSSQGGTLRTGANGCTSSETIVSSSCTGAGCFSCCKRNESSGGISSPTTQGDWTGGQCGDHGCCNNQSTVRSKTGWTDASAGSCHDKRVYTCSGKWVPSNVWLCPGDDNIVCCVPPAAAPPPPPPATNNTSTQQKPDNSTTTEDTSTSTKVNVDITCTSSGQLCSPSFTKTVQTHSVLKVNYTVGPLHCSGGHFSFFVDGVKKTTKDLGWTNAPAPYNSWPLTTGTLDFGPVSSGAHELAIQVEGIQAGCNTGKVGSWQGTVVITKDVAPVTGTKLTFDLQMHGIGKSGDNRNPTGGGNTNPNTKTRNITVQLFDPNDANTPILTKDGKVEYDPVSGSFKVADLDMGNALTTKTYIIRINSQSLRGKATRDITAGTTNIIPVMTLVNGDANWDGKLDIEDYHLIQGCVRDFDLPPADCDGTRAQKADLDDDGTVGIFDLNLFIRELSVQAL